jgi:hypothetical protein
LFALWIVWSVNFFSFFPEHVPATMAAKDHAMKDGAGFRRIRELRET